MTYLADFGVIQWSLLLISALVVGFAKTGISGAASVAVLLFAFVLPAKESTGALLLVLICGDVLAILLYRRHSNWRLLIRLLPWVLPGIVLGAVFVSYADDAVMRRSIGVILLLVVALQLVVRRRPTLTTPTPGDGPDGAQTTTAASVAVGVGAGFLTMVANAAGPLLTVYLILARLPMLSMLGTGAWYFFLVNLSKVPFSVGLGLIRPQTLLLCLPLIPAVLLGGLVGRATIKRLNQRQFENMALVLAGVASVLLII